MPDTPTDPAGPIPSSEGIVATAGKQPLAWWQDLDRDGIADWQQKKWRRRVADLLYWVVGRIFPNASQSLVLRAAHPMVEGVVESGK